MEKDKLIFHKGTNHIFLQPRWELPKAEMALDLLSRIDTSQLKPHAEGGMYLSIYDDNPTMTHPSFRVLSDAAGKVGISLASDANSAAIISCTPCVENDAPPEWTDPRAPSALRLNASKGGLVSVIEKLKQGLQMIIAEETAMDRPFQTRG